MTLYKYWFIGDRDGICAQRMIRDKSFAKSAGHHCETIEEANELLNELVDQGCTEDHYVYRADIVRESIRAAR